MRGALDECDELLLRISEWLIIPEKSEDELSEGEAVIDEVRRFLDRLDFLDDRWLEIYRQKLRKFNLGLLKPEFHKVFLEHFSQEYVSEAKSVVDEIRQQIQQESRTLDVATKRSSEERISDWMNQWESKSPVSFAIIDMDGLKSINDEYGHRVGDQAIEILASELSRSVDSKIQESWRRGGAADEFCVVFAAEPDLACEWLERLKDLVSRANFVTTLSFSAGVASCPTMARSAGELEECADEALRMAKRSGRNMVARYDSPPQFMQLTAGFQGALPLVEGQSVIIVVLYRDKSNVYHALRVRCGKSGEFTSNYPEMLGQVFEARRVGHVLGYSELRVEATVRTLDRFRDTTMMTLDISKPMWEKLQAVLDSESEST